MRCGCEGLLDPRRDAHRHGQPSGQDELLGVDRHDAVFTNSTEPMLIAEAHHSDHAIEEQVIADLKRSAMKHFPSSRMDVNADQLTCAVIAHNLARAAEVLADGIAAMPAPPPVPR